MFPLQSTLQFELGSLAGFLLQDLSAQCHCGWTQLMHSSQHSYQSSAISLPIFSAGTDIQVTVLVTGNWEKSQARMVLKASSVFRSENWGPGRDEGYLECKCLFLFMIGWMTCRKIGIYSTVTTYWQAWSQVFSQNFIRLQWGYLLDYWQVSVCKSVPDAAQMKLHRYYLSLANVGQNCW